MKHIFKRPPPLAPLAYPLVGYDRVQGPEFYCTFPPHSATPQTPPTHQHSFLQILIQDLQKQDPKGSKWNMLKKAGKLSFDFSYILKFSYYENVFSVLMFLWEKKQK